jgi:hypothetical protein
MVFGGALVGCAAGGAVLIAAGRPLARWLCRILGHGDDTRVPALRGLIVLIGASLIVVALVLWVGSLC